MDESKKHRAVLHIAVEVHGLNEKTGECDGHMVSLAKLKEFDISPKKLYKVDGENLFACLSKLKQILEQIK